MPAADGAGGGRRRWTTAGVLLGALAAGLLLTLLSVVVLAHPGRPPGTDQVVHGWFLHHRAPVLTAGALALTRTGNGPLLGLLAAAAGVLGGGRKHWCLGAPLAVAVLLCGQRLRLAVNVSAARPRPPVSDWATTASGFAYPSGHTTNATLVAGLLVLALQRRELSRRVATTAAALAALWALGVGVTRVYLGVHWPTDVLAGWLFGLAFVLGVTGMCAVGTRLVGSRPRWPVSRPRRSPAEGRVG